jgi:DNA-binding CsgD family transcriptional regulator
MRQEVISASKKTICPSVRLLQVVTGGLTIRGFTQRGDGFVVSLERRKEAGVPIALRRREQRIIASLLAGFSQKQIGYSENISPATVSGTVRAILRKLGLTRWEHMVTLACALRGAGEVSGDLGLTSNTPGAPIELSATVRPGVLSMLSPAEREVALYVVAGFSNSEIGGFRRTSARTVANQISSLFRKLDVRGRLELVLRMLASEPAS